MKVKAKKEINMSDEKRSSVSKGRDAKTNAYRNRFEKNQVKARNPWPDPFASNDHKQGQQVNDQKTSVRASGTRSKSDRQNKTRN